MPGVQGWPGHARPWRERDEWALGERPLAHRAPFPYIANFRMDETRLKRLRFRAWRRGFREADLILGPFADSRGQSLTEDQTLVFEQLLAMKRALIDLPDYRSTPPGQVLGLHRADP